MRILMVNYEYPPLGGGGGVAMQVVARELAKRHEVHILTSRAPGLAEEETSDGGRLRVFRARSILRKSNSVASIPSMLAFWPFGSSLGDRLAREHRYDVINTWFAIPSGPTGCHVAERARIPHLLTIIGGDIYDPSKWYSPHRNPVLGRVVRSVLGRAERHTAISSDIARRAAECYGFDRPVEVISLGIDEPRFTAVGREALGLRDDRRYVVSLGRHVRRKDLPTLVRAVAGLDREDVELILIGDGPESGNLKALAKELGIADRVRFPGFVDAETKYRLLAASDVFALTSLHEGFGLVYLEAMHCGLPVVASRKGGQEDFLVDGETGALVDSGDIEATRGALDSLLGDEELRTRVVARNREIVRGYYASSVAEQYERLLAETSGTLVGERAQ